MKKVTLFATAMLLIAVSAFAQSPIAHRFGASCPSTLSLCTSPSFNVQAGDLLVVFTDTSTSNGVNVVQDSCHDTFRRDDGLFTTQFMRVYSAIASCSGSVAVSVKLNGSPDVEFEGYHLIGTTQNLDGPMVRNPATSVNQGTMPICNTKSTTAPDFVICAVAYQVPQHFVQGPFDNGPTAASWVESDADQFIVDGSFSSSFVSLSNGLYGAHYNTGDVGSWTAMTIAYKLANNFPTATATPSPAPTIALPTPTPQATPTACVCQ